MMGQKFMEKKFNNFFDKETKQKILDAVEMLNILEDNQLVIQKNQVEFEHYLKDILAQVTQINKHLGLQNKEIVDTNVIEVDEETIEKNLKQIENEKLDKEQV